MDINYSKMVRNLKDELDYALLKRERVDQQIKELNKQKAKLIAEKVHLTQSAERTLADIQLVRENFLNRS